MVGQRSLFFLLLCLVGFSIQACPDCKCCKGKKTCDSKNHCKEGCIAGYYGEKCTKECPENCQTCEYIYSCQECKPGYFTEQCKVQCGKGCLNNTCAIKTGQCTCKSTDFQKGKCEYCADNKHGDACTETCPSNCGSCSSNTNCSWCKDSLYYGPYCQHRCSHGCEQGTCNQRNGKCIKGCKPGYKGEKCDPCSRNELFGMFCNLTCPTHCSDCFSESNCTECKDGFYGDTCTLLCPSGCNGKCSVTDGRCMYCKPGFFGVFCNNTCIDGTYGHNCSKLCNDSDVNCRACFSNELGQYGGCIKCKSGHYPVISSGRNYNTCLRCTVNCRGNESCDNITGECLYGCIDGYEGVKCFQAVKRTGSGSKFPTIIILASIGVAIAVIIVIVLFVLFLIKRRRSLHSRKLCKENKENENTQEELLEFHQGRIETKSDGTYAEPVKSKRQGDDETKDNSTICDNDSNSEYALINNGDIETIENIEEVYDTTNCNKNKIRLRTKNEYALLRLKSNKPVDIDKGNGAEFEEEDDTYNTTRENKNKNILNPDNDYASITCKNGEKTESDTKNPLYDTTCVTKKEMHPVNNDYDVFRM